MDMDPEEVVLQAREPDGVPTFIGALFFSSLVSSLLIGWHFGSGPDGVRHLGTMLVFFLASALTHSLCGLPFVAVLFWMLRGKYRRIEAEAETVRSFFVPGVVYGLVASPFHFCNYIFSLGTVADELTLLRIAVIFVLSGASAGWWIAWRFMAARGLRFRFTLATLLLLAVASGALLWLFSVHLGHQNVARKYFSDGF